MGQYIDLIVTASKRNLGLAEKLAVGVTQEIFARKPRFETTKGETIVDCNHPAFVFGHLALYPARVLGFAGGDPSKLAVPAHYSDVFKAGVECKDDPEGSIYPEREEILGQFFRTYNGLYAELSKVEDSTLLKPHPDETIREKYFPTIGNAMVFMLNNHVMMHLGQISTWRRCFGLPSAM